jgi:hypothetical protein
MMMTSKGDEIDGHVERMGEMRNEYKILVGKPEDKRPLGRLRHRRKDNIKIDLHEGVNWIYLAQDRNDLCTDLGCH